jgi:hypothetical protein
MVRVALVAALFGSWGLLAAACSSDPVANVCSTPNVCGTGSAGFRLCTRQAGSEAIYLLCDDRTTCDEGRPGVAVVPCVSPSDCADARAQAVAWCAMQP